MIPRMIELAIVVFLVLVNGFFAMSEMALVTARRSRLRQLAEGSRGAQRAVALSEHPENFLSTVQIGISLLGILLGLFGGEAFSEAIAARLAAAIPAIAPYADTIGLVLAVAGITYLSLVLGELLPKRLAIGNPELIASRVALPMYWLARAAAPAVWLLAVSTRTLLRMLGRGAVSSGTVSDDEIRLLVAEGHEQGVIESDERDMLNRVLRLGDRRVESLMTPRTRIAWLDATASLEDNLAVMRETPFARYPVLRGSDQDVVGVLELKTLAGRVGLRDGSELFAQLRAPLFVPESTPALKLLDIFREEQQTLALVVDEYGDITGMVSLNDLFGAVLGRFQALESEIDEPMVVHRQDGSMLIDGRLSSDEMRDLLGIAHTEAPESDDYHTVAGLVIALAGRIPAAGEGFDWGHWHIEVVDLDGPRIDKLLVSRRRDGT